MTTAPLLDWLRSAFDDEAAQHTGTRRCDGGDFWWPDDGRLCKPALTVVAHRRIVGRHSRTREDMHAFGGRTCEVCGYGDQTVPCWPCPDLRDLILIYRDTHPGFNPDWLTEETPDDHPDRT